MVDDNEDKVDAMDPLVFVINKNDTFKKIINEQCEQILKLREQMFKLQSDLTMKEHEIKVLVDAVKDLTDNKPTEEECGKEDDNSLLKPLLGARKENERLNVVIANLHDQIHQLKICLSKNIPMFYSINNEDDFFVIDVIVKHKVNIPNGFRNGFGFKQFVKDLRVIEHDYMENLRNQICNDIERKSYDVMDQIKSLLLKNQ